MKIKINDIVTITDTGSIYPGYIEMAKILRADIDGKWVSGRGGSGRIDGKKAKVLNKSNRTNFGCVLIEMLDLKEQYIIGIEGIEIDEISNILDDKLFEI